MGLMLWWGVLGPGSSLLFGAGLDLVKRECQGQEGQEGPLLINVMVAS